MGYRPYRAKSSIYMKWNLNANISFGFCIAVTLLLAVGIISYYSLNRFRNISEIENQTRTFLSDLENINTNLKDLESGLFGFIITGDSAYLRSYENAGSAIAAPVEAITSNTLVAGDKTRQLKEQLNQYLDQDRQLLQTYKQDGQKAAIQIIRTGESKKALRRIRHLISQIENDENRIKGISSKIASLNAGNAMIFIIAGNIMGLSFLIAAFFLLNRDIGIRIKTEEELSKAIEVAQNAKNKEKQFLANMSHEIRTPMNAIIGMTNLILNTPLEPRQTSYLKAIKQASDNLMVIINEILDFSKITAGKIEFEEVNFDLSDIIYGLYNTFKIKADEKQIKLNPIIDENLPDAIIGDPGKLNQVLVNLIGNSVKFTSKGYINIVCRLLERKEDALLIEFAVEDSGIGIPQDKLATIFEDFVQAASDTSRKFGGTGLGLSISKKIVELQGGKIRVESEPGKGSVFSFCIWYKEGHEKPLRKERTTRHSPQELHGIKILLVEDNEFNQVVAVDTLKSLIKNLTIDIAENGRIAIEKLTQKKDYDIILMDVQMPEMNGYETTRHIRAHAELGYAGIPVLAMTASATKPEIDECFNSGMTGFVSKPIDADILLIKISSLLNKEKDKQTETEPDNHNHNPQAAMQNTRIVTDISKVTDLTFLKSMTAGNSAQMLKYIDMFLDSVPDDWNRLKILAAGQNWPETRVVAHSMKPRINYMGIKEGGELIRKIEINSGEQTNLDAIPDLIITFENILVRACKELESEKQTILI